MFKPARYILELGTSLVLYALLLVGANLAERHASLGGGALLAVHLMPMLGALAAAWAIMRALWRMDEMQRRIQLEAIAISFLGTALITFGWGFAEGAGLPRLHAFAVWPIMAVLWVAGLVIVQRRYR